MNTKREMLVTGFRIISVLLCVIAYFRNDSLTKIFIAIAVICSAVWLLPNLLTALAIVIFKIKENYYGTLQYDDTDITDCKFRMIFNVDPEVMVEKTEFLVKVENTNLRDINSSSNGKE